MGRTGGPLPNGHIGPTASRNGVPHPALVALGAMLGPQSNCQSDICAVFGSIMFIHFHLYYIYMIILSFSNLIVPDRLSLL